MPAQLDLDIYRGDSMRMQLKLSDVVDGVTQPSDLTGVVAKAEIRDRPAGNTVIPLTVTIELPNIINVFLPPYESIKLPPAGVWDLQLTYASGEVKTPVAGQVQVTADVTDSTPYVQHYG